MRMFGIALVFNLASIAAVLAAAYLAALGIPGWGWFLLVGVLLAGSIPDKPTNDENLK
jgi:hypothetical protein